MVLALVVEQRTVASVGIVVTSPSSVVEGLLSNAACTDNVLLLKLKVCIHFLNASDYNYS